MAAEHFFCCRKVQYRAFIQFLLF